MVLTAVLSGAVSAVFGAAAYHYADTIKRRYKLLQGVHEELLENYHRVQGQIDEIEQADRWSKSLTIGYHDEVFNTLRTADPGLYAELADQPGHVVIAYRSTKYWNNWVEVTRHPEPKMNYSAEEMIDILEETLDEIDTAIGVIETRWERGLLTQLHPGLELKESDLN